MIIFRDVCTSGKDELLSDVYNKTLLDDIVYEVEAKMVTVTANNNFDIGGNPSAEGEDVDDLAADSRTVNNIVEAFRLVETSFDKKGYMTYIKDYMKKLTAYLKEKHPDRVEKFQKAAQDYVKKVLGNFSDYQFFTGESMDPEGMVVLCYWKGETPIMVYFKDGFEEYKV